MSNIQENLHHLSNWNDMKFHQLPFRMRVWGCVCV